MATGLSASERRPVTYSSGEACSLSRGCTFVQRKTFSPLHLCISKVVLEEIGKPDSRGRSRLAVPFRTGKHQR